jgi:hypothetical protein
VEEDGKRASGEVREESWVTACWVGMTDTAPAPTGRQPDRAGGPWRRVPVAPHSPQRANDLVSLHHSNQMLIPCSREQLLKSGRVSHVIPFEALELPSTGDKYGARLQQSVQTSLRNPRQRCNYKLTRKMGCECSVESPRPASCLRMLGSRTYAI